MALYINEYSALIDIYAAASRCQACKNIMKAQPVSKIETWVAVAAARRGFLGLRRCT